MARRNNLERRLRAIVEAGIREVGKPLPPYRPKPKPPKKVRYARHSSSNPNSNQFTKEEIQTATLINTEGTLGCLKQVKDAKMYGYPHIRIAMCDKEALEPATKVFKTNIVSYRLKTRECPDELFPPDGKGRHIIEKTGKPAQEIMEHLNPLITPYKKKQWKKILETC